MPKTDHAANLLTSLANALPANVPFVGPETQERARGGAFAARLGANENVFGPSPKVLSLFAKHAGEVWRYADPESHALKAALAKHHNIAPECIAIGEGVDGLLGYLVRLMVSQDDPVVTSYGAYPTFNYHVTGYGGRLITVPYDGDYEDPEALVEKAKQTEAKLLYFANPDNPMGTVHKAARVQKLIDATPQNTLLVLDEAYIECAPEGSTPEIDTDVANVIRMRTFSKAYGMAGARVGYAIGHPDIIAAFDKVRNHFGMPRLSQIAALAALEDQEYLCEVVGKIARAREKIYQIAAQNGLQTIPSATNFVAIDCGGDGAFAKAVLSYLLENGVFVRMPFVSPQDRCIRLSAGDDKDLALVEELLPKALANARNQAG